MKENATVISNSVTQNSFNRLNTFANTNLIKLPFINSDCFKLHLFAFRVDSNNNNNSMHSLVSLYKAMNNNAHCGESYFKVCEFNS